MAVIVVLYGLSDFLKLQSFDATGVQSNTMLQVALSIENDINRTITSSRPADASNNLDDLITLLKDTFREQGYIIDVRYNLTSSPKTAAILITYPGMYYEKTIYPA